MTCPRITGSVPLLFHNNCFPMWHTDLYACVYDHIGQRLSKLQVNEMLFIL